MRKTYRTLLFALVMGIGSIVFLHGNADAQTNKNVHATNHRGFQIIALPPTSGKRYDVSILPGKKALDQITKALDLIYERSIFNRDTLERLQKARRLVIVYNPDHYAEDLGSIVAATFRPKAPEISELIDNNNSLVASITRHGIKWPVSELASAIIHELIGHGIQYLDGRLLVMRELDRECEARLRQEQGFQDFGLSKLTSEMIQFRQVMEYHYCVDFIKYMRAKTPERAKTWDTPDPDVANLLEVFRLYLDEMLKSGTMLKSAKAAISLVVEDLKRVFKSGNPQELYTVALTLLEETGRPDIRQQAATFLRRAAKGGYVDAQYRLGTLLLDDKSDPDKGKRALYWYKKAGQKGHLKALNAAAFMMEKGDRVPRAPKTAAKWYAAAAKDGHLGAQYRLGIMYEKGDGLAQNYKRAAGWYLKAAKRGHPLAQSAIGYQFEKGLGVKKDLKTAMNWYLKGAKQGYARPQYNVGVMYAKGRSVARDDAKAVHWLHEAALQSSGEAQRVLGIMYLNGRGVAKNRKTALSWFNKAVQNGDKKAVKLVKALQK